MRAANLGSIAARNEKLAANKASMLRNDQQRIEQMIKSRVSHHPSVQATANLVKQQLADLAKTNRP